MKILKNERFEDEQGDGVAFTVLLSKLDTIPRKVIVIRQKGSDTYTIKGGLHLSYQKKLARAAKGIIGDAFTFNGEEVVSKAEEKKRYKDAKSRLKKIQAKYVEGGRRRKSIRNESDVWKKKREKRYQDTVWKGWREKE